MIKPENIVRHELIGLRVKVYKARNRCLEGIEGIVVDETKNMLIVETKKGEKMIPKKGTIFHFYLNDKVVEVDGDVIAFRPEDRIKRKVK